jgi:hypothetical protein
MSHVRHFVVDECDKCLENIDMRADVQVGRGDKRRGRAGLWGAGGSSSPQEARATLCVLRAEAALPGATRILGNMLGRLEACG